jgi:hypothetical protein
MAKVQVVACKCGEIFAACWEPMCYEDKDWLKNLRKYSKRGCGVSLVDSTMFRFGKCTCSNEKLITNQLKLDLK